MAYFGSPFGVCWGNPDDTILSLDVNDLGNGALVEFQPAVGYAGYYGICVDGYNGPVIFATDTGPTTLTVLYQAPTTNHAVSVVPQGNWSIASFDQTYQQTLFQEGRTNQINVDIPFIPTLSSAADQNQFTNWNIVGWERFINCMAVPGWQTGVQLGLTMTTDVNNKHTVTLTNANTPVASGTINGNGTVQLIDLGSGIGGSVHLNYNGYDFSNGAVLGRYPASYRIYYRSDRPWLVADFTGPNPPTPNGTLVDDGHSISRSFVSPNVAPALNYVVTHSVTDAGIESIGIDNQTTFLTVYVPRPPTNLAYVSGGAAATIVSWTGSLDNGSTYNIYDSKDTGLLPLNTPSQTHAAGLGTILNTLPAISGTFTGVRYVLVRSLLGGVEEGNSKVLTMEYINGVVLPLIPNVPFASPLGIVNQQCLTVNWTYDVHSEGAHPTGIELYLWDVTSNFNSECPNSEVLITVSHDVAIATNMGLIQGQIEACACYDGIYYWRIAAVAPSGTAFSPIYGPIPLSASAQPDPNTNVGGGL